MNALRNAEMKMIRVWGMGGVGKTTLMKQVAEQAKQKKLFTTEVYIDVSWTRDSENFNKELLKFNNKLQTYDIWEEVGLKEVGIPCKDDQTECKVALTSRDLHILNNDMDAEKCFRIQQLTEEEAWSLFNKTAGGSLEKNLELRPIAMKVVEECEGLPIAIVTIAKALKGGSLAVWQDALNGLRACAPTNIRGVSKNVYSLLKSSHCSYSVVCWAMAIFHWMTC
ncbi:hypothetical protein AAG906_013027 [Vitis piasezkii]